MTRGLVVDLFAGGGGASTGLEAALGRPVDIGINHDKIALAVHKANHPRTRHLEADIWEVKPTEATEGKSVDILWASPDCTHFSVAKGDVPKSKKIRSLAWAVARWARATRPKLIFVENVMEFRGWGPLNLNGKPNKRRSGETFKRWTGQLERLGYTVDFRIIDASLHGAPTRRRRLFLIARRDGQSIAWPEPTHGPGKLPLHTAAECIDWNLRCPSIFERKRPLAPKTLWRIGQGLKKYVLEAKRPFIVRMAHGEVAPDGVTRRRGEGAANIDKPLPTVTGSGGGGGFALAQPVVLGVGGRAGQSQPTPTTDPLGTVTAKNDRALVLPSLVKMRGEAHSSDVEDPVPTITAGGEKDGHTLGLLAPSLMKFRHDSPGAPIDEPLPTITAGGKARPERQATGNPLGLAAASLLKVNHGKREARGESVEAPLSTVTAQRRGHAVAAAALVEMNHTNAPRSVEQPLGAVTTQGNRHNLVAPVLAATGGPEYAGEPRAVDVPASTVLPCDKRILAAATLIQRSWGEREGQAPRALDIQKPLGAVVAGGIKQAPVMAFLSKGYGEQPGRWEGGGSQSIDQPAPTVTSRDHSNLAAAALVKLRGECHSADVAAPVPTITADGLHIGEVRAFLTAYYGSDKSGQSVLEPMRTLTAKHRLGLVTVEGVDYQIVDIGMRMLEPYELLRAQFGRFAAAYDMTAAVGKKGKPSKTAQVRLIGNSVCPEAVEALVRANVPAAAERVA